MLFCVAQLLKYTKWNKPVLEVRAASGTRPVVTVMLTRCTCEQCRTG